MRRISERGVNVIEFYYFLWWVSTLVAFLWGWASHGFTAGIKSASITFGGFLAFFLLSALLLLVAVKIESWKGKR